MKDRGKIVEALCKCCRKEQLRAVYILGLRNKAPQMLYCPKCDPEVLAYA